MAKKTVENLQPMGDAREAINDNFTELYNTTETDSYAHTARVSKAQLNRDATVTDQLLPDAVVVDCNGLIVTFYLDQIRSEDIKYTLPGTGSNFYLRFTNVQDPVFKDCNYPDNGLTTSDKLFDLIASNTINAINFGSKSEQPGGAGSLSVIKAKSNFSQLLPDEIVCEQGNEEVLLRLLYITPTEIKYEAEDHGTAAGDRRYIWFKNDSTGDWHSKNTSFFTGTMSNNTLPWFIENGRAVYHGHTDETGSSGGGVSSVAQLTDVDVATAAPTDGQVLVYDDSDSKWKPGAQSTDFVNLTDTPATLDAGSYLRVNTTGDAIEQIKTAPPDGGAGDNSLIQTKSNFASKLPDSLISTTTGGEERVYKLLAVNSTHIYYDYWSDNNNYFWIFNNDLTGSGAQYTGATGTTPGGLTASSTLQSLIDNGRAIFHGQKSGTSGAGSLSSIKSLVNSSPNGGFYTELPDALHVRWTSSNADYTGLFKLHWIKPNEGPYDDTTNTANQAWEMIYRVEDFGDVSGDYSLHFIADADGTNVTGAVTSARNKITSTEGNNNNLRWFIENGRAVYYGGQQDFGVKAWGSFDGTQGSGDNYNITGFTGGNVSSIERISNGLFKVTFINPAPHANYCVSGSSNPNNHGGAHFGVRETNNPVTTTDFHIEIRRSDNVVTNSNRISFQVVY